MEEIIYSPKLPNQSGPDREFESSSIVFQSLCFVHYECLTVSLKAVKVKKLRRLKGKPSGKWGHKSCRGG